MRVLQSASLRVEVLDPHAEHDQQFFGNRYVSGGWIWQITDHDGAIYLPGLNTRRHNRAPLMAKACLRLFAAKPK